MATPFEMCYQDANGNDVAVSATNPLPIAGGTGGTTSSISATNSSTTPLGANGVFTGTSVEVLAYSSITVGIYSDQASATDGLSIQQSSDGTNWDIVDVYSIPALTGKTFSLQVSERYLRVVYTNGATLQTTFRLQTILHSVMQRGASTRPQDGRSNDNDFDESLSYQMVYNGTTWDRLRGTAAGGQWTQGPVAEAGTVTSINPIAVGGRVRNTSVSLSNAQASYATMTTGGSLVVKAFSVPEVDWTYAPPVGGISNTTTAVTIKAAAGAGLRNYITGIDLSTTALGAATELAIRDGAAGTVIWRTALGAAFMPTMTIQFDTPLRGTANTLLEIVTLTATVTGNVYVNARGYAAP